ncbi:MAG: FHA domain-containing protein, partial [Planctomycetota bacterium]
SPINRFGEPTRDRKSMADQGLLWVDAVGGYLLHLESSITIGQAIPGSNVDLQILGDLSRHHATITRDSGEYLLDPLGPVQIFNQTISEPKMLNDGDEILLGTSVSNIEVRFRKPNVLSSTARLEFLSHHRTQPSADGVILFAETCVLGASDDSHVVCRDWEGQVILMPTEDGRFRFKANDSVTVDDVDGADSGIVDWGSRMASDDFAFMLERL